jgi:hypothetical protein
VDAPNNTAVGGNAGAALTTGSNNIFIGMLAGLDVTTGNANTIIGSAPRSAALSNNIILADGIGGVRAQCDATGLWTVSSSIVLGRDPVAAIEAPTKQYVDTAVAGAAGAPGAPVDSIQFNNAGAFGGDPSLTWVSGLGLTNTQFSALGRAVTMAAGTGTITPNVVTTITTAYEDPVNQGTSNVPTVFCIADTFSGDLSTSPGFYTTGLGVYVNSKHTGTTATAFQGLNISSVNTSDSTGEWNIWTGLTCGPINYGSGHFFGLSGIFCQPRNYGTSLIDIMSGVDSNPFATTAGTITNFYAFRSRPQIFTGGTVTNACGVYVNPIN